MLEKKIKQLLLRLVNAILEHEKIPDVLKTGLLTHIFKNKGDQSHATNCTGITLLPVVNKINEAPIRERIQPLVLQDQIQVHRGFTAKSHL